jgi:cell shape-determining protein MreC
MQPRKSWFLGIVIVLLLFFIFLMPSLGMRLRGFLGPQAAPPDSAEQLAAENNSLKAQLAGLAVIAGEMPSSTPNAVRAMVYSDYPFNFKSDMTVNAGSEDGIAPGDAVLFEGNLVGIVAQSSESYSVVQTMFDPNFKLPVRIGTKGYDALLVGGSYPMAESIAKTATIAAGDVVTSAGTGVPYGIAVGTVQNVTLAANNLFEEASLSFPYDTGMIQTVEIVR